MTRTPWTLARRSFLLGAGLTALAACSSPAGVGGADAGPRGEPAGGTPPQASPGGEPAGLEECRQALVRELTGREEGFVRDGALVAGRPVRAVLTTPVRPSPQAR